VRITQSSSTRNCLRFGIFAADLASRELRKNGTKAPLQDQPFLVLAMLLENFGQMVTREELRQKVWPADTKRQSAADCKSRSGERSGGFEGLDGARFVVVDVEDFAPFTSHGKQECLCH